MKRTPLYKIQTEAVKQKNGQHKQKQCERKMKLKTKFLRSKNHEN